MDDETHTPPDGPDTLIWRIAADGLALAVHTAGGLVRASSVHPAAGAIAQQRIDVLRAFALMLLHETDELQKQLDGTGQIGEFDRVVDGFWSAADDADAGEAA